MLRLRKTHGVEQAKAALQEKLREYEGKSEAQAYNSPMITLAGKTSNGGLWYNLRARQKGDGFENHMKAINEMHCGGSWCISQPSGSTMGQANDNWAYSTLVREGGPRITISYDESTMEINEIRGIGNMLENVNQQDILDMQEHPIWDWGVIKRELAYSEGEYPAQGNKPIPEDEVNRYLDETEQGNNYQFTRSKEQAPAGEVWRPGQG